MLAVATAAACLCLAAAGAADAPPALSEAAMTPTL
jgi:hypothetical protein